MDGGPPPVDSEDLRLHLLSVPTFREKIVFSPFAIRVTLRIIGKKIMVFEGNLYFDSGKVIIVNC